MKTSQSMTRAIAPALALLVTAGSALAQSSTPRPPAPGDLKDPPTFLTWFLAIILVALCVAAVNIPSKRGHQD